MIHILRGTVAGSGKGNADIIQIRLALRCVMAHCTERRPLDAFWNAAVAVHRIGASLGDRAGWNCATGRFESISDGACRNTRPAPLTWEAPIRFCIAP